MVLMKHTTPQIHSQMEYYNSNTLVFRKIPFHLLNHSSVFLTWALPLAQKIFLMKNIQDPISWGEHGGIGSMPMSEDFLWCKNGVKTRTRRWKEEEDEEKSSKDAFKVVKLILKLLLKIALKERK